jgi:hypothetical protein
MEEFQYIRRKIMNKALLKISRRMMEVLFTKNYQEGQNVTTYISKGLPEDAVFLNLSYNADHDQFIMLFQSAEFEEVPEGHALPLIDIDYKVTVTEEVPVKDVLK